MISTIIFDLSEVYLTGIVGSDRILKKKINSVISEEYFYNDEFNQFMHGKISEELYWNAVIKKNKWTISPEILKEVARENFKEIKGTREIIERLKEKGYTLALLSNHGAEWIAYCEDKYKYHKLFHKVLYSYEVGVSKPNDKIFKILLTYLKVIPQECLLIDDNFKNIESAKNLSMQTIQFTSSTNLKKKLKSFEIKL